MFVAKILMIILGTSLFILDIHLLCVSLEFSYVYRVEDKEYFIDDYKYGKYGDIPNIVTVHYRKNKPERAYIPNMTCLAEPLLCGGVFPFWVLFLVCGILL